MTRRKTSVRCLTLYLSFGILFFMASDRISLQAAVKAPEENKKMY